MTTLHPVSENYGPSVLKRDELTWTKVNGASWNYTEKAPFNNGLLIRTVVVGPNGSVGVALTFVPEAK